MKGNCSIFRQLSFAFFVASGLTIYVEGYAADFEPLTPKMTAIAAQGKFYAIQVGASKTFIQPDQYRKKLGLDEAVRYFTKDGWYKYYIGKFDTEAEAKQYLGRVKIKGFVTQVENSSGQVEPPAEKPKPTRVEQEKPAIIEEPKIQPEETPAETTEATVPDTGKTPSIRENTPEGQKPAMGFKELYFKKIHEADSLFNRQSNLKKAKALYREASSLSPEKTYPRDQIVEIDKLLAYRDSQGFFSKLSQKAVIGGFLVIFFVAIIVIYLINRRNPPRPMKPKSNAKSGKKFITRKPEPGKPEEILPAEPVSPIEPADAGLNEVLEWGPTLQKYLFNRPHAGGAEGSDPSEMIHEINNALNSDEAVLRMESELALMRLFPEDPLAFLDHYRQDLTPYEQVHVYEALRRLNLPVPDFHRWTDSENSAVARFSRRMVKVFRQDRVGTVEETGFDRPRHPAGESLEWLSLAGPGFQDCAEHYFSNRIRQEFFGGF